MPISNSNQFDVDAINKHIVIISYVALAHFDDPVCSTSKGVIHPTLTRRWHESRAMKLLEMSAKLLQLAHQFFLRIDRARCNNCEPTTLGILFGRRIFHLVGRTVFDT